MICPHCRDIKRPRSHQPMDKVDDNHWQCPICAKHFDDEENEITGEVDGPDPVDASGER